MRQNDRVGRRNVAQIPDHLRSGETNLRVYCSRPAASGFNLAALQEHAVELTNSEAPGPVFPPPTLGPIFLVGLIHLSLAAWELRFLEED